MSGRVSYVSHEPLVLRIKTEDMNFIRRGGRAKQQKYTEGEISDPDDIMTADEEEDLLPQEGALAAIEAPPPGTLSTLWYSRECFLDVWVVEKICGWKKRSKYKLVDKEGNDYPPGPWHNKLLAKIDKDLRPEISRINPAHSPLVLAAEARFREKEEGAPKLVQEESTEEVLLIKWRGRSHLHCSWEREEDIIDKNRNKIKRFYQSQMIEYGEKWKEVLEEDRLTAANIHSHGEGGDAEEEQVEYFSPGCREVDRIMACDENHVDPLILARQRALNYKHEKESLLEKERNEEEKHVSNKVEVLLAAVAMHVETGPTDIEWDPEDNVRYVVRWKGLGVNEVTWEYWRDIKRDAVEEVEDFWYRQQPPSAADARRISEKPHPHVKDFRKLKESPLYGISSRERPVADLEDDQAMATDEDDEGVSGFQLRGYQLEGVNWLLFNWWNRRSCILADEMGLGKTIQSAAFLQELQRLPATEVRGPFLIVAPLSLVSQWQSELASWAPDMNVILYHGSADAREFIIQQEFWYSDQFVPKADAQKLKKTNMTKFHVLITTYEVALKDMSALSKVKWKTLIVDEAHRLKNSKSRLFEELKNLPRDYCVLLTGTPIANATEELWALLHFANPAQFRDKDDFLEKFGQMTDSKQVNELHNLLKPYLLRRVKEDVEKSLPPKEETILEVSLTPIQKTFYKAIYERNTQFLFKGAKPSNAPSLMNVMMELRKCCNHPYLVKGAEERIISEAANKLKDQQTESGEPTPIDQHQLFAEQLIKSSGKMVLLEKLLHKLFNGGHKILIFSQMVRVLDLLEELLRIKRYKYERLDGSTSSTARLSAVDRFRRKSAQRFVMLLSTRAGGLGLNLTAADTVIIYDSDWNPQNDLQAMARAHRIGQTRAVRVYRLLTAKTYEMHMFHSASLKLGLERAVLSQNREQSDESDDDKRKKSDRELQAKEIDELLKKGAYDVFRDEDDAEAEKFMEKDIDQLLEHSAKTVTYGASATQSIGSGLGSFSKASFVADTGDGEKDVDLDDPDFWSKAVGLDAPVETPENVAAMLDDGVKRQRKQVQVYDPYAETAEAEQRKKDRLALEKLLEKEEKDRMKEEKKLKKKEAQEKKKRDREDGDGTSKEKGGGDSVKSEPKAKKSKKSDRQRALKRAENEDPMLERLKQGWEVQHRNKATAAALRFGIGRFCKIRGASNLTSLPIQDIEVFVRAFCYQLSLQLAASLTTTFNEDFLRTGIKNLVESWIGVGDETEMAFLCETIHHGVLKYLEVQSRKLTLRIPVVLTEPTFLADLQGGSAVRSLRRIGLLQRLSTFVEHCLDSILESLGPQELGKRGCPATELANLDVDLKARFVTAEELALAVSSYVASLNHSAPVVWWDRRCDISLIIGAFVHGFGNYQALRDDTDFPFVDNLRRLTVNDEGYSRANDSFRVAARAAKYTFDDALEAGRIKAELEVQAAVAAAARAAAKREEDAALLRKGGAEAENVISEMPETQVENAFEYDGTDSHFVTLPRLQQYVHDALRDEAKSSAVLTIKRPEVNEESEVPDIVDDDDVENESSGKRQDPLTMPMPDARVLDFRLAKLLKRAEQDIAYKGTSESVEDMQNGDETDDTNVGSALRNEAFKRFLGSGYKDYIDEFSGVGIGASQCSNPHKSLNDGSDYAFGSASPHMFTVAHGTDAPRYLRAIGVPMNITRYALSALAYSEVNCASELLRLEKLKYYGKEDQTKSIPGSSTRSGEVTQVAKDNGTSAENHTEEGQEEEAGQAEEKSNTIIERQGIDPVTLIPEIFRESAKLRAVVCLTSLFYGVPPTLKRNDSVKEDGAFTLKEFSRAMSSFAPDLIPPPLDALNDYIHTFFLPHCLRLCLNGNGPTTRNARGSEGKYETAFGVSVQPHPLRPPSTSLPDPCVGIGQHSIEAVGYANAVLRRAKLLKASHHVCSMSGDVLERIARSRLLGYLDDMPHWWCPWVHDIALVKHAASNGLFSVIPNRKESETFKAAAVKVHLVKVLQDRGVSCPEGSQAELWASSECKVFPTLFQLERRLALLCSLATSGLETNIRYDNLPMFDHGGWPRK